MKVQKGQKAQVLNTAYILILLILSLTNTHLENLVNKKEPHIRPISRWDLQPANNISEIRTPLSPVEVSDPIEEYIRLRFKNRSQEVLATFKHENGYQLRNGWDYRHLTTNVDGSQDLGIAKINSVHWDRCGGEEALENPYKNIDCALMLYNERESWGMDGLTAWYSYVNGKHLMFM